MMKTATWAPGLLLVLTLGASAQTPSFEQMRVRKPTTTLFPKDGAAVDVQVGPNKEVTARPGGHDNFDGVRSVITTSGGINGVGQVSAISGTVRGQVPNNGANNNGFPVALFGNATCEVSHCNVWSLNTTATDGAANAATPGTVGRVIQNEFDMNVWNSTTVAKGLNVVLNAFTPGVSPTFAFIAEVNTLSPPWAQGFSTSNGAAAAAFVAGARDRSGTRIPSQPLVFNFFNASGTQVSTRLTANPQAAGNILEQMDGDGFKAPNFFLPNGGQLQFAHSTGGTPVTALTVDANQSITLGLNAGFIRVPTDLRPSSPNTQSVGSPVFPFATVAARQFYAGNTQGVSCNGPPTANFQVTNGIVTRC